jgi:hypothetical protein
MCRYGKNGGFLKDVNCLEEAEAGISDRGDEDDESPFQNVKPGVFVPSPMFSDVGINEDSVLFSMVVVERAEDVEAEDSQAISLAASLHNSPSVYLYSSGAGSTREDDISHSYSGSGDDNRDDTASKPSKATSRQDRSTNDAAKSPSLQIYSVGTAAAVLHNCQVYIFVVLRPFFVFYLPSPLFRSTSTVTHSSP